jgi:hypothetical protein
MTRIELAPEVLDDFDRFFEHTLPELLAQKRLVPRNVRQLRRGDGAAQVFVFDVEHLVGIGQARATTSSRSRPAAPPGPAPRGAWRAATASTWRRRNPTRRRPP